MKLDVKETYSLELDREELEVLFNLIGKVTLGPDNPPMVQEVVRRFKELREESVEAPQIEATLAPQSENVCDGCETQVEVELKTCPATGEENVPLCPTCFLHRTHLPK